MIGSQRRAGTVLTHLRRDGYSKEALERVHTPIGLDIGADTPEEIAVAVVAELIATRRSKGKPVHEVKPLSDAGNRVVKG